jgi:hypothetical protein
MARVNADLPFLTFGDLVEQGLRATVYCPGCRRETTIAVTPELRDKRVVVLGRVFRCQGKYIYGQPCESRGVLYIQQGRRLTEIEAERAHDLALASRRRARIRFDKP